MFIVKAVFFLYLLNTSINALDLITQGTQCLQVRDCPHIYELIKTKRNNFGTTTLLNLLNCAKTIREFKIHCIDEEKTRNFMENVDTLNGDNCGLDPTTNKISGGDVAAIDEFPWVALLRYKNKDNVFSYGCHGNLINKKYILTAAHCVDPKETKPVGDLYSVILGEYNITSEVDCVANDCNDGTKEIMVESYIIHPEFNLTSRKHDIALIRLKTEVEYSDFIKPICLPPPIFLAPYNETLYIAGWGLNDRNQMNPIKLKAKFALNPEDDENCKSSQLTNEQYCASSKSQAKTCQGDSGGPLMVKRRYDIDRQHLIGINSLGIRCNFFNVKLSIYTKVSSHMEWILTNIQK